MKSRAQELIYAIARAFNYMVTLENGGLMEVADEKNALHEGREKDV